jgi:uncharacterized protein
MKFKLTFLLSLTFLFLFSGSVFGDDYKDGSDAFERKDYKEALRLLSRSSAQQDNKDAQYVLGIMYYNGIGIPQDYKRAFISFALSARQGVAGAQFNLGRMYNKGQGVPQDYKEAARLYRLSAEQGDAEAQANLGWMYDKGQGVPQDYKETVRLYRLAAEQGNAIAQHNLGLMSAKGQGVLQDYALAHMWLNICGSGGNKDCVKYRNIVEKHMTKQQIEKAQEMARNWKPKK